MFEQKKCYLGVHWYEKDGDKVTRYECDGNTRGDKLGDGECGSCEQDDKTTIVCGAVMETILLFVALLFFFF